MLTKSIISESVLMGVCGTGLGNFPQPGDPSNDSILSATSVFGGIQVSWTYPNLNPQAVAHTILYRATSGAEGSEVFYRIVTGDSYFDQFTGDDPIEYFYWIRHVSVNGTEGDLIGPASAVATSKVQDYLDLISGQIDASKLNQDLMSKIDRIELLDLDLASEIQNRINGENLLGVQLTSMQTDIDGVGTSLQSEINTRQTEYSAMLQTVNTIQAGSNGNLATIEETLTALADENESQATAITQLQSTVDNPVTGVVQTYADLQSEMATRADADSALTSSVDTLTSIVTHPTTGVAATYAGLTAEQTARADADTALTNNYNALLATVTDPSTGISAAHAAIQSEQTARANADSAIASDVTTIQASLDNPTTGLSAAHAAIQTEQNARISEDNVLAQSISNLEASMGTEEDITVQIEENNRLMIGYCVVGGQLDADSQTPAECTIAGGTWVTANAFGESVRAVQVSTPHGTASVQQTLTSHSNELNDLSTEYLVKLDTNDYVTGFGLVNDGSSGTAVFNVDNFYIGRGGVSETKPFVVIGGGVYINQAYIYDLTVDKLKASNGTLVFDGEQLKAEYIQAHNLVVNNAQSLNYIPGSQGWDIDQNGNAEFHSITIYDGTGNVAFQSGVTDILTDATVGNLAYLDQITNATYIATGVINNAHIGNAAVDTLEIAGNAVTAIEVTETNSTSFTSFYSWETLCVLIINHGHTSSVNTLVTADVQLTKTFDNDNPSATIDLRFYDNGTVVNLDTVYVPNNGGKTLNIKDTFNVGTGTRFLYLQGRRASADSTTIHVSKGIMTGLAAKR